ncbi:MAG: hypothetical protein IIY96_07925 [Lachnospiraceae bacterium]|nr:hypothetical protein [Lachnospiraceae bacterium]
MIIDRKRAGTGSFSGRFHPLGKGSVRKASRTGARAASIRTAGSLGHDTSGPGMKRHETLNLFA